MALIKSILKSTRVGRNSRGWWAIEKHLVTGIATELGALERVHAALTGTSDLPQYNDPISIADLSIHAQDITGEATDNDKVEVTVEYGNPTGGESPPLPTEGALIEIGAVIRDVETNMAYTGADDSTIREQIVLEHDYIVDDGVSSNVTTKKMSPMLTVPTGLPFFRLSRSETVHPGELASTYVGTVNKDAWTNQGDGGGADAPRTWSCEEIIGQSDDNGLTYNVHYHLVYNYLKWDKIVHFLDPDTGEAPPGLVVGKGVKAVRARIERNWNSNPGMPINFDLVARARSRGFRV